MRAIAIDTNVLVRDFHLSSSAAKILLRSKDQLNAEIILAQPVLDEACSKYKEHLATASSTIEKAAQRLSRLANAAVVEVPSLEHFFHRYEAMLQSVATKQPWQRDEPWTHFTHAPYPPTTDHSSIFSAIGNRRAPFLAGDRGYKDYIIWMSLLEWLRNAKDVSSFWWVSENKKDFGADGHLHPDLSADLEALELDPTTVVWRYTLKELVQDHVKPLLDQLEDLRAHLERDARFTAFIEKNLERIAIGQRFRFYEPLSLPGFQDSDEILKLEEISEIAVGHVYELSGARAAEGSAVAVAIVSCSVAADMMEWIGEEILSIEREEDFSREHRRDYNLVKLRMRIKIDFSALSSDDFASIEHLEMTDLSGGSFDMMDYLRRRGYSSQSGET